jgi:hypothetical protein
MEHAWQRLEVGWHRARRTLKAWAADCSTCRECGARVGPFDEICTVCSAAHPARLRPSASLLAVLAALLSMILLVWLA